MLGRVLTAAAAVTAVSLMLSGCINATGSLQFPSFMRPTQPASYTPAPYYEPQSAPPTVIEGHRVSRNAHEHQGSHRNSSRSAQMITPAPPPAEAVPQPTVTLAGDGEDRDHALRLLNDAGARLAKIDRNKLGKDSAATYDQASGFLSAGRKAALNQDYVAATGDAEKASVLADKLNTGPH